MKASDDLQWSTTDLKHIHHDIIEQLGKHTISKHSFSICVQDECEFDFTLPWQVAAIYAAPAQRKPIGW